MRVEILYFEPCPHFEPLLRLVTEGLTRLGISQQPELVDVTSDPTAMSRGFLGSPTLLINGRDLEDKTGSLDALGCRFYGGGGLPPSWMIEAALLRALRPKHLLFMCVQNSARSQLAHALARAVAPKNIKLSSAGSKPAFVRPQALVALEEIGIDTTGLSSTGVDEVDTKDVDCVITLCAEEVCPVYLGQAWRLHWGLPDPAQAQGSQENQLQAFRDVRDELLQRLTYLFTYDAPPEQGPINP